MYKTLNQWNGSGLTLDQFLTIGDQVDEDMVDYFISVLPPAHLSANIVQMGEPVRHSDSGQEMFNTIYREAGRWIYAGVLVKPECSNYEFLHKKSLLEG